MKILRTSALALGPVAMIAVAVLAAGPAQADSSDCSESFVCMWEDPNYSGSRYVVEFGRVASINIGGFNGDNEISAVANKSDYCITLYDNDNYTGTSYYIRPHTLLPNLEQNGYDNEAESFRMYSC